MAFQDQYRSWSFGENSSYGPSSQCSSAQRANQMRDQDNSTHMWGATQWNYQDDNLWDNRVKSVQVFCFTSSFEYKVGEDEVIKTNINRLLTVIDTMIDTCQDLQKYTETALEQNLERI